MLEAHRQPGVVARSLRSPRRTPGAERRAVQGVVADRERLPQAAEDDLLVGDEPAHPQAVHADAVDVGAPRAVERRSRSRRAPVRTPASRRAAAISSAVRRAVPLGASALSGWCSSTISTDSKNRAASAENRIIRIAPIEKFGATSTPVLAAPLEPACAAGASRSSSNPVVPTTAWMPWSTQNSRLSMTTSGWVKSTTACAPALDDLVDVVVGVDRGHEVHVLRRLDGPADLLPDLAACPEDADLQLLAHRGPT